MTDNKYPRVVLQLPETRSGGVWDSDMEAPLRIVQQDDDFFLLEEQFEDAMGVKSWRETEPAEHTDRLFDALCSHCVVGLDGAK